MTRALPYVLVLASGLLFGAGLVISDMANAGRVMAFLQLDSTWDATLAWVMASALAVSVPGFAWVRRRGRPVVAGEIATHHAPVDGRVITGAALFGLGWGLAGYCPGPALVSAGLGIENAWWFVPAMLAGAGIARLFEGVAR